MFKRKKNKKTNRTHCVNSEWKWIYGYEVKEKFNSNSILVFIYFKVISSECCAMHVLFPFVSYVLPQLYPPFFLALIHSFSNENWLDFILITLFCCENELSDRRLSKQKYTQTTNDQRETCFYLLFSRIFFLKRDFSPFELCSFFFCFYRALRWIWNIFFLF